MVERNGGETGSQVSAEKEPVNTPETPEPATPAPSFSDQHEPFDRGFDPSLDLPDEAPPSVSETPPVVARPPEAVKPKHSATLTRHARELGFTEEEIDSYTPDQLEAAVYHAARAEREMMRQQRQQPAARQPEPPAEEDELDFGEGDYEDGQGAVVRRKGTEKDFHPGLVKVLKSQQKELKEARKKLETYEQAERRRQAETQEEQFDRLFTGAKGYEHIFGKDKLADLAPDAAERHRRLAVVSFLANITKKTTLKADFEKAVKAVYGNPKAEEPEDDDDEELRREEARPVRTPSPAQKKREEEWANGGLARPATRKPAELPHGEERAIQTLSKKMRGGIRVNSNQRDEDAL